MFNLPARIGTQHETALGQIPEGWDVRRLRTLVTMLVSNVDKHTKDGETSVRLCNYVDVYKRDVITAEQAFMVATASVDEIDSFRLHADDVVITKDSESFNDIGVPAYVASAADDLVCGYHLAILRRRSPELNGQYLHWALRVPAIAHQLHVAAGGVTRFGLSHEDIKSIRIPVPSAEEQAAIVKYLAHANARIDKAIAAKRRLIALTEEQSASEVESLLEGSALGADEPMLGRALRVIEQGKSPSPAEGELADDQWAVLSLSAVNRGQFVAGAVKPVDPAYKVPEALEVRDGDLLMTRSNTRERVGDVAIAAGVRPKTIMPDLIYRLVPRDELLSADFACLVLRSRRIRNQIEVLARGSSDTMPKLAQGHIKSLRIPLPPRERQSEVISRAKEATKPIAAAIDRVAREVALLQEFRARLVADVVAGQVDVRGVAASLQEVDLTASWGDPASVEDDDKTDFDDVIEANED